MSKSGKKKLKKTSFAARISRHNRLTFGRHDHEGMLSDDSDDSDYEPQDEDQPIASNKKRKRGKKLLKSHPVAKKLKKSDNSFQTKNASTCSDWSHRIPNELLFKIFMYAVYNFTAVPLLCRVKQVCQKWNAVASDPCLWYKMDLSYMANYLKAKDETLSLLQERNFLKYVKELDLSGWQKLTSSGLEVVAERCKDLTLLNLSRCKRVTARGISLLACNCNDLTSINLSYIQTDATSNMSIKNLVQERGRQLETLCLAGNKSIGTPSLVAVQSACGNLKVLDLSSTSINNLHVERLQAGCPHLVELRLSQLALLPSTFRGSQMVKSAGFSELELLSLASITGGDGTNDMLLQRLLRTSSKLRQLDLRGCEKITHRPFSNLATVALEQLFLSRCKLSWKDLFKIIKARWKESLKELDVSWGHDLNDAALLALASPRQTPNTVLTALNLAGSGVTAVGLRSIVNSCPNLGELNLTSCRGVPRGHKQLHDAKSMKKLRTQLHNISTESVELDTPQ